MIEKENLTLEQTLENIKSLCESVTITEPCLIRTIVVKPKREVEMNPPLFVKLVQVLYSFGATWYPIGEIFVISSCVDFNSHKSGTSQVGTSPTGTDKQNNSDPEKQKKSEIDILRTYFGTKTSISQAQKASSSLLNKGLTPDEIALQVGIGRSTLYRLLKSSQNENEEQSQSETSGKEIT